MSFDFEAATRKYKGLADEIDHINMRVKQEIAARRETMQELEAEITLAAKEAGLKTVPTTYGTVYWSTLSNCKLDAPEEFFAYVRENEDWSLIEKRANKSSVVEYIEEHGAPPPGVSFSTYRKFNLRRDRSAGK